MKTRHLICLGMVIAIGLVSCVKKSEEEKQVDAIMKQLSTREKIAQLISVSADSYNPPAKRANRDSMVAVEHVGGLIIMHDSMPRSIDRLNELQRLSPLPLMVSIDGEWGPSMRYSDFPFFPRQMQLGALTDDSLIYEMGRAVAEECKMLNVYINFAPVADINVNPNNPVIGSRSFGEYKEIVTRYACAYMRGMQDGGIYACAKHFPGHGDTDVDSHKDLPLLPFSKERLDSMELYPFRELIKEGVALVMIGHLNIPALDSTVSTLSYPIATSLLKKEMGFKGIVCTDALNMKGVSDSLSPAEVALAAYKAGADMLLMPNQVSHALDLIEEAIEKGECSKKDLNERCRKMLMLKAKAGMFRPGYSAIIDTTNFMERLQLPEHRALVQEMCDKSMTIVENKQHGIPLDGEKRIAYVGYNVEFTPVVRQYGEIDGLSGYCPEAGIYEDQSTTLYQILSETLPNMDYFPIHQDASPKQMQQLGNRLKDYDLILLVCHDSSCRLPKANLIADSHIQQMDKIMDLSKTILVHYGMPYGMNYWPWVHQLQGIVMGYADSENNQIATAKVLLGQQPAMGKLPVSVGGYRR